MRYLPDHPHPQDDDCTNEGNQNLGMCTDYQSWCCSVSVDTREDKPLATGEGLMAHTKIYDEYWDIGGQAGKQTTRKGLSVKPYGRSMERFAGTVKHLTDRE